jgi:hypothetical protein
MRIMLLLFLAPSIVYFIPSDIPASSTLIVKNFESMSSLLISNASQYLVVSASIVSTTLAAILVRKAMLNRDSGDYMFSPKRKVRLGDVWRFGATYFVEEYPNTFGNLLKNVIDGIGEKSPLPIWVKLNRLKRQKSYLLERERNMYELEVLGEKRTLDEFVNRFQKYLEIYKSQNFDDLKILRVISQHDRPKKATDVNFLKVPNLELGRSGTFGINSKIWLILAAIIAALTTYLITKSLPPTRRLDSNKATNIASGCVERIYGVRPRLLSSTQDKDGFVVNFEGYSVKIDNEGNVTGVVRDGE